MKCFCGADQIPYLGGVRFGMWYERGYTCQNGHIELFDFFMSAKGENLFNDEVEPM